MLGFKCSLNPTESFTHSYSLLVNTIMHKQKPCSVFMWKKLCMKKSESKT